MYTENFSSLKSCPQCDRYDPNNPINIKKGRKSQGILQKLKDKHNNCISNQCDNDGLSPMPSKYKYNPGTQNVNNCTNNCYRICNRIPKNRFQYEERLKTCLQRCNDGLRKPYKPCKKWIRNNMSYNRRYRDNRYRDNRYRNVIRVNKTDKDFCKKKGCRADSLIVKDNNGNGKTRWSIDCNRGCEIKNRKCSMVVCPSTSKKYDGKCVSVNKMDPNNKFSRHPLVRIPLHKKWCKHKRESFVGYIDDNIPKQSKNYEIVFILCVLFIIVFFIVRN